MTGRDFVRILRRRWMMIVGILVGFSVLTVAGTVMWRIMWPRYTAIAVLRVNPPTESLFRDSPFRNTDMLERYKRNVAQMGRLPHVLRAALDSEKMRRTMWFQKLRADDAELKKALTELSEEIVVWPMPESDDISISMSMYCGSTAKMEQLPSIVNAVAEAMEKQVNSRQDFDRDRRVKTFQSQLEDKAAELRTLETEISNKERNTVEPMTKQLDAVGVEVEELIRANAELMTERADLEEALASMMAQRREGTLETNPLIMRALEADPILRGLEADLTSSSALMEIVESKYGPEHPQRKTLGIRIRSLRREIGQYSDELVQQNITSLFELYQQQLKKTVDILTANSERLDGLRQNRRDMNNALREITRMEKTADQLNEEIKALNARLTDLQMVREDDKRATIISPATVPTEPSGPLLVLWIPAGVFVGLLLGVGLALLLELTDTSVRTSNDLTHRAELPLLAMIPHADDLDDEIEDYRLACMAEDHSMVTEAFRELWTSLQFSGPLEKRRSLLVTSASPYDGRTCVSVNLALTVAQGGKRVLLVDTNFRRPAVSSLFPSDLETGLSDALSGQAPWTDCVYESEAPNLAIMAAGKMPPNPTELLASDLAGRMFSEMREQYDQVIFDSPPLLLISDARVLATRADGIVVVVRAGVNTYGIVQRCRRTLTDIGAHIVGGVLNGVRTTAGGYLQKNYDAFHEYQEAEM